MDTKNKWPGGALQRADRAGLDKQAAAAIHHDCRPTCHELQARWLRTRHGIDHKRARVLAVLIFGEGQS